MTTWPTSADGDHEITVASGVPGRDLTIWTWLDSHSGERPARGPYLALHGVPQVGGAPQSLVVHLDQVPALVAALTAGAAHLSRVWEQEGGDGSGEYWDDPSAPAPR